jgi:hypothetical protein
MEPTPKQPEKYSAFTQRSPQESICMICYATVRAEDESLKAAQERHLKECSGDVGRLASLSP